MTQEQKIWFALLGADLETFEKYMACSDNCVYRSIKGLYKYNNLPESALRWAQEQGFMDISQGAK